MTLDEARTDLLEVYASARAHDQPSARGLVFSGGLEVDDTDGMIRIINWAYQVLVEDGVYVGRVQGRAQMDGPTVRGTLEEVVRWLCTTGADELRAVRAEVTKLRRTLISR